MKPGRVFLCAFLVGAVACAVAGYRARRRWAESSMTEAFQAPAPIGAPRATPRRTRASAKKGRGARRSSWTRGHPRRCGRGEARRNGRGCRTRERRRESAAKWAGEYVGSDLTTARFEGMPERVQPDDKARTRVEEPKPGQVVLIVVDSSNGSPLCSLNADATGSTATIHADQSCFGSGGHDRDGSRRPGQARRRPARLRRFRSRSRSTRATSRWMAKSPTISTASGAEHGRILAALPVRVGLSPSDRGDVVPAPGRLGSST